MSDPEHSPSIRIGPERSVVANMLRALKISERKGTMVQVLGVLLVLALALVASADRLMVSLGSVAPSFRVTLRIWQKVFLIYVAD